MHTVHVLTVSSGLPMKLLDALLGRIEAVLHEQGASRIWVDPAQPGTTVLAEFAASPAPAPCAAPDLAPERTPEVTPELPPELTPELGGERALPHQHAPA